MTQNIITGKEESTIAETSIGPVVPGGQKHEAVYTYDIASQGGAVGTIILRGPLLPLGAIVVDSFIKVLTALTSGGAAEVAIGAVATGDIQTAAAVSGAPWSTTGNKDTTAPEPGVETGYLTLTAQGRLRMDITVAALLTGKFQVVVTYDLP